MLERELEAMRPAFGTEIVKLVYALTADPSRPLEVERVRRKTPVTPIDDRFNEYFSGLDRAGNHDRCYLCRRTPAEVKAFFGFDEDGVPSRAADFGLEDIVLEEADIMSYRGARPVCAVCQLNFERSSCSTSTRCCATCSTTWSTGAITCGPSARRELTHRPRRSCTTAA
jgi:hypothetical protein